MSSDPLVPETRVVYGYVGNTMAAFVMQSLGCDVAALNTVQFSNHTGYKQWRGTKASAEEIMDLYTGLKQSYLTDFDVLLTGYAPSAEAVDAIGSIARDLKLKASTKAGKFFWALDPVMGDEGRLYVAEEVVPAYRNLLRDADLILPNQFEAEVLSEVKITSLSTLSEALSKLHKVHRIPHIVITSIRLPEESSTMSIIGSTARADFSPRIFKIDVPAIDCYFSGTGDMFAALTVVRLREAITEVNLNSTKSWVSPDEVEAIDLPLAKATEKVLGSMHTVLTKTKEARDKELEGMSGPLGIMEKEQNSEKRTWLRKTKAAEVKVTRCLSHLRQPTLKWKAVAWNGSEDNISNGEGANASNKEIDGDGERAGLGMQHLAGQGIGHRRLQSSTDSTLPHRRG
ncbi:pyridoxine kinase, partial [Lecanoromycetidae sp. Uapishka_2]